MVPLELLDMKGYKATKRWMDCVKEYILVDIQRCQYGDEY